MSRNPIIKKWQLRRRLENAVKQTNSYLELNPEANAEQTLRASLSRAMHKTAFLERNKKSHNPWRTDCYNELDEVTVYGTKVSSRLNSSLYNNRNNNSLLDSSLTRTSPMSSAGNSQEKNFWNTPIDTSFKNAWPNARLDWFDNRVSGNPVYGDGSGSEEFGNQRGKNSVIGKSYDMREWATPSGGGGNLKFFAHKNNYTKHLVNLISEYIIAKGHGDNVGDEVNGTITKYELIKNDTLVEFVQYRITDTYKNEYNRITAVYHDSIIKDSAIKKSQIKQFKNLQRNLKAKHKKNINDLLDGN